jgi:hypothetical protein
LFKVSFIKTFGNDCPPIPVTTGLPVSFTASITAAATGTVITAVSQLAVFNFSQIW